MAAPPLTRASRISWGGERLAKSRRSPALPIRMEPAASGIVATEAEADLPDVAALTWGNEGAVEGVDVLTHLGDVVLICQFLAQLPMELRQNIDEQRLDHRLAELVAREGKPIQGVDIAYWGLFNTYVPHTSGWDPEEVQKTLVLSAAAIWARAVAVYALSERVAAVKLLTSPVLNEQLELWEAIKARRKASFENYFQLRQVRDEVFVQWCNLFESFSSLRPAEWNSVRSAVKSLLDDVQAAGGLKRRPSPVRPKPVLALRPADWNSVRSAVKSLLDDVQAAGGLERRPSPVRPKPVLRLLPPVAALITTRITKWAALFLVFDGANRSNEAAKRERERLTAEAVKRETPRLTEEARPSPSRTTVIAGIVAALAIAIVASWLAIEPTLRRVGAHFAYLAFSQHSCHTGPLQRS